MYTQIQNLLLQLSQCSSIFAADAQQGNFRFYKVASLQSSPSKTIKPLTHGVVCQPSLNIEHCQPSKFFSLLLGSIICSAQQWLQTCYLFQFNNGRCFHSRNGSHSWIMDSILLKFVLAAAAQAVIQGLASFTQYIASWELSHLLSTSSQQDFSWLHFFMTAIFLQSLFFDLFQSESSTLGNDQRWHLGNLDFHLAAEFSHLLTEHAVFCLSGRTACMSFSPHRPLPSMFLTIALSLIRLSASLC